MSRLRLIPVVLCIVLAGCGDDDETTGTTTDTTTATTGTTGTATTVPEELAPFVALAEGVECAEDVNRLFRIDDEFVLWHTEDLGCSDASYQISLFGSTPDEELCSRHDSIEGPVSECSDESLQEVFETIASNVDQPDLGLGADHSVELVWEAEP